MTTILSNGLVNGAIYGLVALGITGSPQMLFTFVTGIRADSLPCR